MAIKFSEDVIPLADLRTNPGKVVSQTTGSHRPVLLTNRGRGVAVMQGLEEYERNQEEREFMRAVTAALIEVREGKEMELDQAKKKLGIA